MVINLDKGYISRRINFNVSMDNTNQPWKTIVNVFTYMTYKSLENDYRKSLMAWHNP